MWVEGSVDNLAYGGLISDLSDACLQRILSVNAK